MALEIIGKKSRLQLREYFVGTSLRTIEMEFEAADVKCARDFTPSVGGARRSLVEQYYQTLDFSSWEDARKFVRVYESVLSHLEQESGDGPTTTLRGLVACIQRDGFVYRDGRLYSTGHIPGVPMLRGIAAEFNAPYLQQQIQTMEGAIDSDPRLAIGTAKELVETTCKTILAERGLAHDPGWDLVELVKKTRAELQLTPSDVPDQAKAAETVKRLLSNLGTLVQGLGELRNPYGTGHGPHARARGLEPRHARLAAGAAATLATFLFETHKARSTTDERK